MIRELLAETLRLWRIDGSVESDDRSSALAVRTPQGLAWIEPVDDHGMPFRWSVGWRTGDAAAASTGEHRPRLCASVAGVLAALRSALGIERGPSIRLAGAALHHSPPSVRRAQNDDGTASASHLAKAQSTRTDTSSSSTDATATRSNAEPALVPLIVLTGFLGSGKTTLLSRLLRDPAMGRTAVIINELGEIGLDHELVEASDESFIQLSNGCLCCTVRSDLVLTLRDLAARRAAGTVAPFERVVVETTGLADPGPIVNALATDAAIAETYIIGGVITCVDAVAGLQTFARHAESVKQAALADCIVLTKTDVPEAQADAVTAELAKLGANVPVTGRPSDAMSLFALVSRSHAERPRSAERAYAPLARHLHGITTVSIARETPLHAATLPLFLSALAENLGDDLLRVKGIVGIVETPDTPAVIHGVQHVYHTPAWLDRWPSSDRRTRIVLIGRTLSEPWPRELLNAIEGEVAAESARRYVSGSPVA